MSSFDTFKGIEYSINESFCLILTFAISTHISYNNAHYFESTSSHD